MNSVGMANPNVQIVDIYDIFILEVCQSGVQLVSISKQYSNYLSYELKKSAPITLVKTYPRPDISGWYVPQPNIGGRERTIEYIQIARMILKAV